MLPTSCQICKLLPNAAANLQRSFTGDQQLFVKDFQILLPMKNQQRACQSPLQICSNICQSRMRKVTSILSRVSGVNLAFEYDSNPSEDR